MGTTAAHTKGANSPANSSSTAPAAQAIAATTAPYAPLQTPLAYPAVGALPVIQPLIQRDLNDPIRYEQLGKQLPQDTSTTGSAKARSKKVDKAKVAKALKRLDELLPKKPQAKNVPNPKLTESYIDKAAIEASKAVKKAYPYASKSISPAIIKRGFKKMDPEANAKDAPLILKIMEYYVDRRLRFKTALNKAELDLLVKEMKAKKPHLYAFFQRKAYNQPGYAKLFASGKHEVGIDPAKSLTDARGTVFHETMHFYTHANFFNWAGNLKGRKSRLVAEGTTELLARKTMSRTMKSDRYNKYRKERRYVELHILNKVSRDDLERAYFLGEIWRLEHQSKKAKKAFKAVKSKGFYSHVEKGHYRLMNFKPGSSRLQRDHKSFLDNYINDNSTTKMAIEGHASPSEPAKKHNNIAEGRAKNAEDFVQKIAKAAKKPIATTTSHKGATSPTATEKNDIDKAFNRRVEFKAS